MRDFDVSKTTHKDKINETRYGITEEEETHQPESHKVRTAMLVGLGALVVGAGLIGLRQKDNKQVNKQMKKFQKRAQKNLQGWQDKALDTWERTQDALSSGVDTAQDLWAKNTKLAQKNMRKTQRNWRGFQNSAIDTLSQGVDTTQDLLTKNTRLAQKNMQKAKKNLQKAQEAAQENISGGLAKTQSLLDRGTRQTSKSLQKTASNAINMKENVQDQYRRYARKRRRARSRFIWGLVVGTILALLYTPLEGTEMRQRLATQWQEYRAYFGS